MTAAPEIVVAPDADGLATMAAGRFVDAAREALLERGVFHVALAGGSTPRRLYERLASQPYAELPWRETHVFFGDERAVAPGHEDSNFRMVYDAFLSRVPVPAEQVHRMEGELGDPAEAAARYEARLRATVAHPHGGVPRLDLVLLGLGADGHTASLFPETTALDEASRLVAAPWVDTVQAHRLTLTLPVLNAARALLFLVAGEDKAEAVRRVLEPRDGEPPLPAARVHPHTGRVTWLLDAAAARRLGRVS